MRRIYYIQDLRKSNVITSLRATAK